MIEIVCFHTCKNENGKEYILSHAPFHSDTTKPQWLGQGYYLWTDSDYYAHRWLKSDYVITQFLLTVDSDVFLDLVGDVEHQLVFQKFIQLYETYLKKKLSKSVKTDRTKVQQQLKKITVSSVINHFRKARMFPYKVVKAQDIYSKDTNDLKFVDSDKETLFYPTRQQVVVYPEARNHVLGSAEWYFPVENIPVEND